MPVAGWLRDTSGAAACWQNINTALTTAARYNIIRAFVNLIFKIELLMRSVATLLLRETTH